MPKSVEKKIAARGGAVRYRRESLPGGKYMTYAITKEEGPRGGRTIAVEGKPVKSKTKHAGHDRSRRDGKY